MEKVSFIWTVVFGLVIGVGANILTPYIRELLGKVSMSARHRNEIKRKAFASSVQYLIDNPLDEINCRLEKNGRYTRTWVCMAAAGILGVTIEHPQEAVLSVVFMVACIYYFVTGRTYERLVSEAWRERVKDCHGLDL